MCSLDIEDVDKWCRHFFYIDLEWPKVKVNFAPNRELPSFCKQVLEGVTPFLCHKSPTNSVLYNVFEVATFSQLIIN